MRHPSWSRWGLGTFLAILFVIAIGNPLQAQDRPNILWLIAEDFGPELGCYGHPQVRTPHIDSLAADGVRFTRAYTTTPVCSTSRSSFMTGMYAWSIGAHNHRSHRKDGHTLPDGVRVLTDWLRDAGYFTANVRHFPEGVDFRGTGKTDWNFNYQGKPFDTDRWNDLKSHQPFYAQVNFPETHRGREWNQAHEHIDQPADPDKVEIPPYYPDHEITRQDWAQYLNTAMSLDRKIGRILELLEEQGLSENTIVVFMADHGRAMVRGKQWPYDSGLHVPLIIRWPEGIPAPEEYSAGKVEDALTASIDVTATTLSWAGVPKPETMQGRVFWGPNAAAPREYLFGGRDRGDETVDRIRTVRDDRFRYLRNFYPERPFAQLNRYKEFSYPVLRLMHRLDESGELEEMNPHAARLMAPTRPREELYDLESDPWELNNLADDPAHRETLLRLRSVLEAFIVESDDQGRFPEPPEVIEHWESEMQRVYDQKLEKLRAAEAGN
ncbi:Arylsulfatase [Maioricimonas rarisocia]|uniref:Arylsulfatase n=1 Tax=Maioricimonas rarisocia TaxID=2528026 RepID=A0A517Z390_9PLAN|nr:sulfatase [Maioricimonas rarisocia]QDU36906.1 Arylsulfatase [Maioricimonas rarisocia]